MFFSITNNYNHKFVPYKKLDNYYLESSQSIVDENTLITQNNLKLYFYEEINIYEVINITDAFDFNIFIKINENEILNFFKYRLCEISSFGDYRHSPACCLCFTSLKRSFNNRLKFEKSKNWQKEGF